MKGKANKFEAYSIIATFLSQSYGLGKFEEAETRFYEALEKDYEGLRDQAHANRVWSNILCILAEDGRPRPPVSSEIFASIKMDYLALWRRAERIKRQISEIDLASEEETLILLKGGLRYFDGLYPAGAHRFMMDIDIHFATEQNLDIFQKLGYHYSQKQDHEFHEISPQWIAEYSKQHHHLPPVVKDGGLVRVELHSQLIHPYLPVRMRKSALLETENIDGLQNIRQLNQLDQLIMAIIHARFADRFADFGAARLRNFIETALLYRNLNMHQMRLLDMHFEKMGAGDALALWKYILKRLLGMEEFANLESSSLRRRYRFFERTAQSERFNSLQYFWLFWVRLFSFGLRDKTTRQKLKRKISSPEARRGFFAKITRVFK